MRILRAVVIVVTGFLLMASCTGRGGQAAATTSGEGQDNRPVIHLSDSLLTFRGADTIDFGRLGSGEIATREYVLLNSGQGPWVITSLDLTCGCIEAEYPRKPLRPGDSQPLVIKFDSRGITGWVYKSVLVYTSLSDRPYTLVVIAEVD